MNKYIPYAILSLGGMFALGGLSIGVIAESLEVPRHGYHAAVAFTMGIWGSALLFIGIMLAVFVEDKP